MKDALSLNAVASAAEGAAEHGGEKGHGLMELLQHHLIPDLKQISINEYEKHKLIPLPEIGGLDISITKTVVLLWVAAFLVFLLAWAGRRIAKKPLARPTRLSGLIEVFVLFVRDEIVHEHMHEYGVKKLTPYFVSLFFFIMFSNLLGLIPGSSTATGNIAVTAGLAILSFVLIQIVGMIKQGVFAYWKNIVPMGVPWPLWLIMWPIEFFGLFTKPFALTIRLFANMTAGHVVILVLLYMIFQFENIYIAPLSVFGALVIYLLEVFICLIQAYIFVALTALFVGSAMHRH